MAIKGSKVGSANRLKRELKKRSGNFLHRVPTDEPQTFRFITEPEQWFGYEEHYDEVNKFFPCSGTPDCEGCQNNNFGSKRWLANAVLVDEDKVVPLVLPKTACAALMRNYDRHKTIMDRDYTITRTGSGKHDTEYAVDAEAPTRVNAAKYKSTMVDLEEMLEQQLPQPVGEDEDEDTPAPKSATRRRAPVPVEDVDEDEDVDDEVPAPKAAKSPRRTPRKAVAEDDEPPAKAAKKPISRRAPEPEPVEDLADEDEDVDLRSELKVLKLPALKRVAKAEYGLTDDDLAGLDANDVIEAIVEAVENADDEDIDEDVEDEDEYPVYTSAELRRMSMDDLKKIAADYEIAVRGNVKQPSLVAKIIAAQNESLGTTEPDF